MLDQTAVGFQRVLVVVGVASAVVRDDRRVRRANHLINNRRGRFAALYMLTHSRHRHIRYQEVGEAPFFGSIAAEDGMGTA